MKTITEAQYLYLKAKKNAATLKNRTKEISDEEYEDLIQYSNKTITPINNNDNPGTEDPDNPEPEEPQDDHDYSQDYLTFEALEDGTFSFTINDLYYSTNNGESWKSLAAGTETELITKGTKVLWKKDSEMTNEINTGNWNDNRKGIGTFSSTCKFNISGNILSLAINDFNTQSVNQTFWWACAFNSLFMNCINLINAKKLILPINDFSGYYSGYYGGYHFTRIYAYMFKNCSNLIYGPKILPSKILAPSCYREMFYGCTSLLESPILPALNLLQTGHEENWYCYQSMFENCTSLKKITMLAKDIEAQLPLMDWVKGVLPGGVFIKNSKSTFDNIGDSGIPAGWEVIDEEVNEE